MVLPSVTFLLTIKLIAISSAYQTSQAKGVLLVLSIEVALSAKGEGSVPLRPESPTT